MKLLEAEGVLLLAGKNRKFMNIKLGTKMNFEMGNMFLKS
jgi:hypothetical protein